MKYLSRSLAMALLVASLLVSCSRKKMDKDIKADITTKAEKEISFAGVNYTVLNGEVNLTGVCPSQKAKDKVESTVKKIAGVSAVNNAITIGPVVINSDPLLKQSVDSVLKKYSQATAQLNNNNVILTGQVAKEEGHKIVEALQKLPVNSIDNRLTIF